jgi:hypothetical protein
MARPLSELQALMGSLGGVQEAYIQVPPTGLQYPCIMIERGSSSDVKFADNLKFHLLKAYTITVVDRSPDSAIPDLVEGLPKVRFDRFFRTDNLNHFVFQMFF